MADELTEYATDDKKAGDGRSKAELGTEVQVLPVVCFFNLFSLSRMECSEPVQALSGFLWSSGEKRLREATTLAPSQRTGRLSEGLAVASLR